MGSRPIPAAKSNWTDAVVRVRLRSLVSPETQHSVVHRQSPGGFPEGTAPQPPRTSDDVQASPWGKRDGYMR